MAQAETNENRKETPKKTRVQLQPPSGYHTILDFAFTRAASVARRATRQGDTMEAKIFADRARELKGKLIEQGIRPSRTTIPRL